MAASATSPRRRPRIENEATKFGTAKSEHADCDVRSVDRLVRCCGSDDRGHQGENDRQDQRGGGRAQCHREPLPENAGNALAGGDRLSEVVPKTARRASGRAAMQRTARSDGSFSFSAPSIVVGVAFSPSSCSVQFQKIRRAADS